MPPSWNVRVAAHAHAIKKLKTLHAAEKTAGAVTKKFITAQKLFVGVEEQLVFAAANGIAMSVTPRHLGMAMAQALIEPLQIVGSVMLQHHGEDSYEEFLTSFFGRTMQISRDVYGFTELSASSLFDGEAL